MASPALPPRPGSSPDLAAQETRNKIRELSAYEDDPDEVSEVTHKMVGTLRLPLPREVRVRIGYAVALGIVALFASICWRILHL